MRERPSGGKSRVMPIRRAAATPTQEKPPSAAAEKEPEAASEESPAADEEQAAPSTAATEGEGAEPAAQADAEPTENGEKAEEGDGETAAPATEEEKEKEKEGDGKEKKELKDGYKYEKAKVKKMKRTIPAWASVSSNKKVPVASFAGTQKVDNILFEAITSFNDRSGVSYQSVMKFILKKYPGMELDKKKFLIKKAMKRHLEKGTIKQLKGKGLSGTFAVGKQPFVAKKLAPRQESLGDALPLIITRLCEPKEASYNLIKKYMEQHFPSLNIERRPDILRSALVRAVEKGQLEQITGTGARGTFQLKRTGNKVLLKGSTLEDAIATAITAMNEPKTCSITILRRYLLDSNKDLKENQLLAIMKRTLTKCKVLGWMEQITGHGLTGTYQLSFPYYPSPTVLYPDKYPQNPTKPAPRRKKAADSSEEESEEEESEEEEEEEESEDEAPARSRSRPAQRRPPPKARRPPPAKKSVSQSKAKGKGRALSKSSVAKKAAAAPKTPAKKQPPAKKEAPAKATAVRKGSAARKPRTPAVKKLNKRGAKRPASRESSNEEEEEEEEEEEAKPVKETSRSAAKKSKREEESPKKSADAKETKKGGAKAPAKKAPAKGAAAKRAKAEETSSEEPAAKSGSKGSKQSTRKSKRGKN